jgi:hypothetical protein
MGDLLGSLVREAKSGQYCVIGGGSLHIELGRVCCFYVFLRVHFLSSTFYLCNQEKTKEKKKINI